MATFPTLQARLLMSSAQLSYTRWSQFSEDKFQATSSNDKNWRTSFWNAEDSERDHWKLPSGIPTWSRLIKNFKPTHTEVNANWDLQITQKFIEHRKYTPQLSKISTRIKLSMWKFSNLQRRDRRWTECGRWCFGGSCLGLWYPGDHLVTLPALSCTLSGRDQPSLNLLVLSPVLRQHASKPMITPESVLFSGLFSWSSISPNLCNFINLGWSWPWNWSFKTNGR